jgi:hypothetical protein
LHIVSFLKERLNFILEQRALYYALFAIFDSSKAQENIGVLLVITKIGHKIIVIVVNPVCCMEDWLGAENPAGTVYKYHVVHLPAAPSPHTSFATMRGEL